MSTEVISVSGGDKMDDYLKSLLNKLDCGDLQVGFMEGATYADGTPVAQVAFWNEFGHGGNFPSPPRPFFRNMVSKESPTWGKKLAGLLKATHDDGKRSMSMLGEDIGGALVQSIINTNEPPLSKTTLRLRAKFGNNRSAIKFNDVLAAQHEGGKVATGTQAKPLIWTGEMARSITYRVGDGEKVAVSGS